MEKQQNNSMIKFCGLLAFITINLTGFAYLLELFDIAILLTTSQYFLFISRIMLVLIVTLMGLLYLNNKKIPGPNILWTVIYGVFIFLIGVAAVLL